MNPANPLVSIVIPVYNGADYLREAVDSALAQTWPHVEVIVVNDGSSDGGATEEIALSYGNRIRYISKENGGVASALNVGIGEMAGEYFSWLSHDDVYYENKVEVQLEMYKSLQPFDIIYSDYDIINCNSEKTGTMKVPHLTQDEFLVNLITMHPVNGCTVLINKACFEAAGLFNETLKTTQDYDMWFRLAKKFSFIHVQQPLIMSRRHGNQGSIAMSAIYKKEQHEFFTAYLNDIALLPGRKDSTDHLLKNAIYLAVNKFSAAADHGYALARSRMAMKKSRGIWTLLLCLSYRVLRSMLAVYRGRHR